MTSEADRKYAEAFAHELAELLEATRPAGARVEIYHDPEAQTPAVRVRIGRTRYELMMPCPGAIFALFRNGTWLGGMGLRLGQADPGRVAAVLMERIGENLAR
jgi:hypothetical protein